MTEIERRELIVSVIAPASRDREHEVLVRGEAGWERTLALGDTQLWARGEVAASMPGYVLIATWGEHPRGSTFHEARLHCIDSRGDIVWSQERNLSCNVLSSGGRFVTVERSERSLVQPPLVLVSYEAASGESARQPIPFPDAQLRGGRPSWSAITEVVLRDGEVRIQGTREEAMVQGGVILLGRSGAQKRAIPDSFVWRPAAGACW